MLAERAACVTVTRSGGTRHNLVTCGCSRRRGRLGILAGPENGSSQKVPAMPTTISRGRFIWHELATTDPDKAVGFYAAVIGWGIHTWNRDHSYRIWMLAGAPKAGLTRLAAEERGSGARPYWLPYVAVEDVDATLRTAAELGGRVVVEPRDIPTAGRLAVLADRHGGRFGVFRPAVEVPGVDGAGRGDFAWHELTTPSRREAWEFYRRLFGWERAGAVELDGLGTYWMFRPRGRGSAIGGVRDRAFDDGAPATWLCYVRVGNAARAAAEMEAARGTLLRGPADAPGGGRLAVGRDPQGAAFAVHADGIRGGQPVKKRAARRRKAR